MTKYYGKPEHVFDQETGVMVRIWTRKRDQNDTYRWRACATEAMPTMQRRGKTAEEALDNWRETYKQYVVRKVVERMER